MSKSTNAKRPSRTTSSKLRGKVGPVAIVFGTKIATLAALLAFVYVLIFFIAVQVVPLTMGFVKSGTGVTLDMPVETVISMWIVPALFLVALEFAFVLVAIRTAWRLRTRIVTAVSRWALGTADDESAKTPVTGRAAWLAAKGTRSTSVTSTKTA